MSDATPRLAGLGSLRFLAALIVVLAHGYEPPLFSFAGDEGFWATLAKLYDYAFPGQAAVILFFVISGLVIHWPQTQGTPLEPGKFWLRRGLRLFIPLGAALLLLPVAKLPLYIYFYGIAWTLLAEAAYYALYPLLLFLKNRHGWRPLVIFAYSAALAVTLIEPGAQVFHQQGLLPTIIAGLPCWLIGCLLAERLARQKDAPGAKTPWAWRLLVVAFLGLTAFAKYDLGIGNPWSLQIFALLCYPWLLAELTAWRQNPPWQLIERLGEGAYSLYLIHRLAPWLLWTMLATPNDPWLSWLLVFPAILAFSWIFYRLIERPSHQLARRLTC